MLAIGLMLFVLKGLTIKYAWKTSFLKIAFWSMNAGLMIMLLMSMLPIGILQTIASINHGMWYARSPEFMQDSTIQTLRWLRIFGDIVFSVGAVALALFVVGLKTGWSIDRTQKLYQ
jgi:nitric oxide reductase subunit B